MATKRYAPKTVATCKQYFVFEGWSPHKISEFLDGRPSKATVENWAYEVDDETGLSWIDERNEYIEKLAKTASPKDIELLYNQRIYEILSDPEFSTKSSDSLRKLQKDFKEMVNPSDNIPVLYGFLEDLLEYFSKHHKKLVTKSFLEAFREYKNYKLNKLVK
ncbi:MAG: hypothetical protein RLN90_09585 [Balneolaceae bacterium]